MITPPNTQIPAVYRRRIGDIVVAALSNGVAMHLHYPGFGHVARQGDEYRFVPEPWAQRM